MIFRIMYYTIVGIYATPSYIKTQIQTKAFYFTLVSPTLVYNFLLMRDKCDIVFYVSLKLGTKDSHNTSINNYHTSLIHSQFVSTHIGQLWVGLKTNTPNNAHSS